MTLQEKFVTLKQEAKAALEAGDLEKGRELRQQAETMKAALEELSALEGVTITPLRPLLPGESDSSDATVPPRFEKATATDEGARARKSFNAAYVMRFGDEQEAMKGVMTDLVGADYRQMIWDQNRAYAKYLRFGDGELDGSERRLLKTQIFPAGQIAQFLKDGVDVSTLKTTMVEAQGTLGGYAVPPNVQGDIITRLPGLTAVRGGGARVVTLANGNSVEIPRYSGGDAQYVGALRGLWGTEAQSPTEDNATLEMVTVVAGLYTYKVSMSQSLVEDAANLVTLVNNDIATTLAIDEDNAFLVGNGAGKPRGILPVSTNTDSLSEVVSGAAAALTADGIKLLKRGIATQYRGNAVWISNSDTLGDIETAKDGAGQYYFPDLSDSDMLLGRRVFESEAMPDVAASAYPLLFGDMSGYWIIERAGLTIIRFQDSNTGINKVEYHVRRRVGGRVAEPWKFAVQKVAAS